MKKDLFKGAQIKYAYDKNERIYTVKAVLNNQPRILTLRVGADFTELSLADEKGNLLEVLMENSGQLTFEDLRK